MNDIFEYIKSEEVAYRTVRIPLTSSKDWNMHEHIERCTNVSNGWYHTGKNDGTRPYDDIATPIINVAIRSEGFDVKDIIPFVNNAKESYKSWIVKKIHPRWARDNGVDTFIDEIVESSVIYDLVLVKKIPNEFPEVVDLKTIAFCDQTDVLSSPLAIRHYFTVEDLLSKKGKWDDDAIDACIYQAENKKNVSIANDQQADTPGKYIEVYEVRGNMPESWLLSDGNKYRYVPQLHIVAFYKDEKDQKQGITLYKGKDKQLKDTFYALKIDAVRSKGRACGRSVVETLFDPVVWNNYDAIKIKNLLDSAFNVLITDSMEIANQNINNIKSNAILKQEKGDSTQRLTSDVSQIAYFQNHQIKMENSARNLGSASELALGNSPSSGTPLGTTEIVHTEGKGMHEYRQGKIATFVGDVVYKNILLPLMIEDLNKGKKFSEELSLDELMELNEMMTDNIVDTHIFDTIIKTGKVPTMAEKEQVKELFKGELMKNKRKFFEILKDELKEIPMDVMINIKGKQRYMAQNADKITNILREILRNKDAFSQSPGVAKAFNQLLEESGMSAIDFSEVTKSPQTAQQPVEAPTVAGAQL